MKESIRKRHDELMNNLETELSRHYSCHAKYEETKDKYEKAKETKDKSQVQDEFIKTRVGCENALPTAIAIIEELQPFLILRQAELQAEQKAILDQMQKASRSQGKWAIGIAIVSLILAGLASFFSWRAMSVSNEALRSSHDWQEKQLPILEQIRDRAPIVIEQVEKTPEAPETTEP